VGVWRGPLIVLVNGGTGSAAEQFAAVLQDNHAVIVMGAPTVGAGCGHTNGGTSTTLKNSHGRTASPSRQSFGETTGSRRARAKKGALNDGLVRGSRSRCWGQ
jgi:hypothetical protein